MTFAFGQVVPSSVFYNFLLCSDFNLKSYNSHMTVISSFKPVYVNF